MKLTIEEITLNNTKLLDDKTVAIDENIDFITTFERDEDDGDITITCGNVGYSLDIFKEELRLDKSQDKFEMLIDYLISFKRTKGMRTQFNDIDITK